MEEKKNKYFIGTIGAFIGAIIGSLPWVLSYNFFNGIYSIMSIFIVIGAFYGYKIVKSKVNENHTIILSICSLISILLTILLIIPCIYLKKSGWDISVESFQYIYNYQDFVITIVSNALISILFAIVMLIIINQSVKKQLKEGIDNEKIRIIPQFASTDNLSRQEINEVKDVFEQNHALDKKNTITKELVMEKLNLIFGENRANSIFNYLKIQKIIVKKSDKYYFSEKAQNSPWYRYGLAGSKTFFIILILSVIIAISFVLTQNKENDSSKNNKTFMQDRYAQTYDIGENDIKVQMPNDMVILTKEEIGRYIGTDYIGVYDCVAVNENFEKKLVIFTEDKINTEDNLNAKEYLKSLNEEIDDKDIQSIEINNNIYYYYENSYISKYNNNKYTTKTYVTEVNNKIICIMTNSPESDLIKIENLIK